MNIRQIREKAYLTQAEFANILGVSATTISAWELERKKPSLRHRKKIEDFCKNNKIKI